VRSQYTPPDRFTRIQRKMIAGGIVSIAEEPERKLMRVIRSRLHGSRTMLAAISVGPVSLTQWTSRDPCAVGAVWT
jgi:hypothetical protein